MNSTILVIEDEPSIADNIVYALSTEGFTAHWRASGGEGMALIEAGGIDLLILDVNLPDTNGFDLAREIRQNHAVPIIFVTARTSEIDRVVGLEIGGFVIFSVVVVATLLVSALITRPIERLIDYVRKTGKGERPPLPRLVKDEIGQLGRAFEEMRTALEGKQYVENYVQTLTHEMKSPLAAIQGAAELLTEEMPAGRRARFLANIDSETRRLQQLIERLLLLTSIENRRELQKADVTSLPILVRKVAASFALLCQAKDITIEMGEEGEVPVRCEVYLIEHAIANLIQNAVEFSPRGGKVKTAVERSGDRILFTVADHGPDIPDYALARVFERFYSLKRLDTGKKSSGLGLSLVRETMLLHGGEATLENLPGGGAKAALIFPG